MLKTKVISPYTLSCRKFGLFTILDIFCKRVNESGCINILGLSRAHFNLLWPCDEHSAASVLVLYCGSVHFSLKCRKYKKKKQHFYNILQAPQAQIKSFCLGIDIRPKTTTSIFSVNITNSVITMHL